MTRTMTFSRTIVALYLLALTGCAQQKFVRTDTPDVHVAPECLTVCTMDAAQITEDPNSIVAALAAEHAHLGQCEIKRQLCSAALKRAQDAGAIK